MTSISLNASDLDATREYLKLFGFTEATPVRDTAETGTAKAEAWGFPGGYSASGFDLSNPADPSAPKIELRRWQSPYDSEPAYPLPVSHLGIHRMIFNSTLSDLTAVAESLRAVGVQEVGPPARCCSGESSPGGIALFIGPDNMVVELTGPIPREGAGREYRGSEGAPSGAPSPRPGGLLTARQRSKSVES